MNQPPVGRHELRGKSRRGASRPTAPTAIGMKKLRFILVVGLLSSSGCLHPYVVKLNNGQEITVPHKPKLEHGSYHYKDSQGKDYYLPAGRVIEIEPASMAKDEQKQFTPPKYYKKRHWYFLWIA